MWLKARLIKVQRLQTKINLVFSVDKNLGDVNAEEFLQFPGYLLFQGKKITKEEEDYMKNRKLAANKEGQTPSAILRGEIFQLYIARSKNETMVPFEEFYSRVMEHFIFKIKHQTLKAEK